MAFFLEPPGVHDIMAAQDNTPQFTCGIDEGKPLAISTNVKNFNDTKLSIQKISDALVRNGYRQSAAGIAKNGNRIEIEMHNEADRQQMLKEGMMYGSKHILFRDSTIDILPVTFLGVPMNVTMDSFTNLAKMYGNVYKTYEVVKETGKFRIKNGNRVVQYTELRKTLPEMIKVNGKSVKVIVKHQQKFFSLRLLKTIADAKGNPPADAKGSSRRQQNPDAKGTTTKRKTELKEQEKTTHHKSRRLPDSRSSESEEETAEEKVRRAEYQKMHQLAQEKAKRQDIEYNRFLEICQEREYTEDVLYKKWAQRVHCWFDADKRSITKEERNVINDSGLTEIGKFLARTNCRYSQHMEIKYLKKFINSLHNTIRKQQVDTSDIDTDASDDDIDMT